MKESSKESEARADTFRIYFAFWIPALGIALQTSVISKEFLITLILMMIAPVTFGISYLIAQFYAIYIINLYD